MECVVNFPRLQELEFVGDRGKYFRDGEWSFLLQSFFLIVLSCFSHILIVYLLGEVDITTPILLFFSFAPYLPLLL